MRLPSSLPVLVLARCVWLGALLAGGVVAAAVGAPIPLRVVVADAGSFRCASLHFAAEALRAHGIALRIIEAPAGSTPAEELAAGRAEAALSAVPAPALWGSGCEAQLLAQLLQQSAQAFFVRENASERQLAEWGQIPETRRLAPPAPGWPAQEAALAVLGLDLAATPRAGSGDRERFVRGEIAVWPGDRSLDPWRLARVGVAVRALGENSPALGDALYARPGSDPARSALLRQAIVDGWRTALTAPLAAAERLLSAVPGSEREGLLFEADALVALSGASADIGRIDAERLRAVDALLRRAGQPSLLRRDLILGELLVVAPSAPAASSASSAPILPLRPLPVSTASPLESQVDSGLPSWSSITVIVLVLVASIAIAVAWVRFRRLVRRHHTDRLLNRRARSVQRHLMPSVPNLPGFEIAVHYLPHGDVSGDLYDLIPRRDGRLMAAVGDVSGHGTPAALVGTAALKSLRLLARAADSPASLLIELHRDLRRDLPPGQFLTLILAQLDPQSGAVTCVRAGHPAAVVIARDGSTSRLGTSGPGIGLLPGEATAIVRSDTRVLEEGETLVLFTDGLIEPAPPGGEPYGEDGAVACLARLAAGSVQHLADGVVADCRRHIRGEPDDDITVVVVRRVALPARSARAASRGATRGKSRAASRGDESSSGASRQGTSQDSRKDSRA